MELDCEDYVLYFFPPRNGMPEHPLRHPLPPPRLIFNSVKPLKHHADNFHTPELKIVSPPASGPVRGLLE